MKSIVLVTPAARGANNGNYRTAERWASMLKRDFSVSVVQQWQGEACDLLLALHARRSHDSIARFKAAFPERPALLALTGTDLYKDIPAGDVEAKASVRLAKRLIVLQEDALRFLTPSQRQRADVVVQSTPSLAPAVKLQRKFRAVMVAHLRDEKDPRTLFQAVPLLNEGIPTQVDLIGKALDEELGAEAEALMQTSPRFRWRGGLVHGVTRQAIRRAHVLVIPSRMEGGAHVVIEAVASGTPVIASRMSGNLGLLGRDYPGYFPVGNSKALAKLIERAATDSAFYASMVKACKKRAPLFAPAREAKSLLASARAALRS